jgi:hypothetical protein
MFAKIDHERFTFNTEASRALKERCLTRVYLCGDPTTKQVVIRPAQADDPDAYDIVWTHPTATQIRATIRATRFLRWLGHAAPATHVRYPVERLLRRAFTFNLAQPESPIPQPEDHCI